MDRPDRPERRPSKAFVWTLLMIVAGAGGALGAVAIAGHGTYDISPFRAELRAWPASGGKTELAVRAPLIGRARTEASTHTAPVDFRVTIVGISGKATAADLAALRAPANLVRRLKEQDSAAVRSFAIKLGLLGLAGGAGGGAVVSFGRWRRIVGGAVIGLIAVVAIGAAVGATYNTDAFAKAHFVVDRGSLDSLPSVLPTL